MSARELELKAVVDDPAGLGARLVAAGAHRTFQGRMRDLRFDLPARALEKRDHVLRLRTFDPAGGGPARAEVSWKGATRHSGPYKEREELRFEVADPAAPAELFARLGYVVTDTIDRWVEFYELGGAVLRLEWYPRMDSLLEVEGSPEAIELAIPATGLPRDAFTADRLLDFAARYQRRTGTAPALSLAALEEGTEPDWPGRTARSGRQ